MSSQSEDFDPVSASQEEEEEAEEEIEEEEQCQEEGGKEIYEENVGEEEEVVEAHFGKRFHEELDSDGTVFDFIVSISSNIRFKNLILD